MPGVIDELAVAITANAQQLTATVQSAIEMAKVKLMQAERPVELRADAKGLLSTVETARQALFYLSSAATKPVDLSQMLKTGTLSSSVQQATAKVDELGNASQRAGGHMSGMHGRATGLAGSLQFVTQMATSMVTAMALMAAIQLPINFVSSVGSAMINLNAFYQTSKLALKGLLSDTSIAASATAGEVASAGAEQAQNAATAIRDVNEKVQDSMLDHAERVSEIQGDILQASGANLAQRAEQLGEALASLAESHVNRVASLIAQIAEAAARYAEQQAERAEAYQERLAERAEAQAERLTELAERHAERQADLAKQLDEVSERYEESKAERQQDLENNLSELKTNHEEARASIEKKLFERTSAEKARALLAGELSEEEIRELGLTDIARALKREDEAYKAQQEKIKKRAEEEEARAKAAHDKQVAQLQERLAKEESEYQKQTAKAEARYAKEEEKAKARYERDEAKAKAAHDRQVASLNARIAEEDAAYARQQAKLEATAEKDMARIEAQNAKRVADLEKQLEKENKAFGRQQRDLAQAGQKAGEAYSTAISKPINNMVYTELPRMLEEGGLFAGITTEAERADALLNWVRKTARELPGSAKAALSASMRLLVSGLDPTGWLKPITAAAAVWRKPVDQVAGAFAALATGRGGEAVEMLRDAGINLRQIADLKWDAQGMLLTPLEEAMPAIKAWMEQRYLPALEELEGGWDQVVSNLGDIWDELMLQMGGPMFENLNQRLRDAMAWLLDPANAEQINSLAVAIGEGLSAAVDGLMVVLPMAGEAIGFVKEHSEELDATMKLAGASISALAAFFMAVLPGALQVGLGLFQEIAGAIKVVQAVITGFVNVVDALARGDWEAAMKAFVTAMKDAGDGLKDIVEGMVRAILGLVGGLVSGILAFFTTLAEKLVGQSVLTDLMDDIVTLFTNLPSRLVGALSSIANSVLNSIVGPDGWALKVKAGVSGLLSDVVALFAGLPARLTALLDSIKQSAYALGTAIKNGIIDGIYGVVNAVSSLGTDLYNAFKGLINAAIQAINDALPNDLTIPLSKLGVGLSDLVIDLPDDPLPKLARGIRNFAGGLAVVGEEGPELVGLPKGSSVYPNSMLDNLAIALRSLPGSAFASNLSSQGLGTVNNYFNQTVNSNAGVSTVITDFALMKALAE